MHASKICNHRIPWRFRKYFYKYKSGLKILDTGFNSLVLAVKYLGGQTSDQTVFEKADQVF